MIPGTRLILRAFLEEDHALLKKRRAYVGDGSAGYLFGYENSRNARWVIFNTPYEFVLRYYSPKLDDLSYELSLGDTTKLVYYVSLLGELL